MNAEGSSPTRPLLLLLAYVPILGLLAAAWSRDREVRWNAVNGQALFAAAAAVGLTATLIGVMVPSLTCLYAVGMAILALLYVSIALLAVVTALRGARLMIPGISSHVRRFVPAER
jgi:predicted ribosome-associated RNA-binding protein Tma20